MTAKKISDLTEVTSPSGTDVLPIVSGGETKKVTVTNLLAGAGSPAGFTFTEADASFGEPAPSMTSDAPTTKPFYVWSGDPIAAFSYLQFAPTTGVHFYTQNADASQRTQLDIGLDGKVYLFTTAGVTIEGLPTSDPLSAAEIFSDGAPGAGDPKVLMISGGS